MNDRNVGAFSFWKFPVENPPASIKKTAPSDQTFAVYQNPVNGYASMLVTLDRPDDISIELYDLLGRKVMTVVEDSLAAGSYKIPFALEPSFNRVLIARLRTSDRMESVQVLVAH